MALQQYSDDTIFKAMRLALKEKSAKPGLEKIKKNTLTLDDYRAFVKEAPVTFPSASRISQRFGTWVAACDAANLKAGAHSVRAYKRRFDAETCKQALLKFLSEQTSTAYHKYTEWSVGNETVPSAQTIRNVLGGSWNSALSHVGVKPKA